MQRIKKIEFWVSTIVRITLIGAIVIAIIRDNRMNLALSLITLFLTFLPVLIEKRYKIEFPSEIEIIIILFIYASLYLGEIKAYYVLYWWWDLFLHTLSGIIIGIIGFYWVYLLSRRGDAPCPMTPLFVATFSVSFAIALGVIWEIFEFSMDSFFGMHMQKSGLVDTMWDLIVDTLGALIVSFLGYFYVKGNNRVSDRVEKFLKRKYPRLAENEK
jgi:hypothetical protein